MFKFKKRELLEISLGTFLVAIGFYYFILPAKLVTGGVMGISVLVEDVLPVSVSLFVLIANVILLAIGGLVLGKAFFVRTVYASILMPVMTFILELTQTNEVLFKKLSEGPILISSVFAGILVGLGLGLVIRNNATTGGLDIVQKMVHKIFKVPFSISLYLIDGTVILLGFFLLKDGISLGFYAVASMLITGVVIDYVLLAGRSGYTVFIVTKEFEALKKQIFERIDRGLTKVNVYGGYSDQVKDMIICTVSRNELYELKQMIKEVDSKAFTFITKTSEALGNGFSYDDTKDYDSSKN